jgi:TDG/mug DNA glycosylase family protein
VLESKIRHNAPEYVAFLGKAVYATILNRRDVQWGRQSATFGGSRTWVLPNPSGLNRGFSLSELTEAYKELYLAVS